MYHLRMINQTLHIVCWVRAYAWGLGLKPLLELDILQKLHYLREGDLIFSHTFDLLICRLNANTTELIYMEISRNIVNGPESNK